MPESAARRTYTADIHAVQTWYAVKLFDAQFLTDGARVSYGCRDPRLPQGEFAVCHQFLLEGNPASLKATMSADDEWRGKEVWEFLPDGFVLQIGGGPTGSRRDGRIELAGTGHLWYGNGLPASTYHACTVDHLRLTFMPR